MLGPCKTCGFALLAAAMALQEAAAPVKPVVPAPETLPFDRVKADATLDLIGASGVLATDSAVWVARQTSGTVSRIDPKTNAVSATVAVGIGPCGGMTAGVASLWVTLCGESGAARVDLEKNALTSATLVGAGGPESAVAFGVGSLWMFTDDGVLARIDPDTRSVVAEIYVPKGSKVVAFDADALWIAGADNGLVTRVDPHTNLIVETVKVGKMPGAIAVSEGAVWVLNRGDGTVSRIDPKSNKASATIDVGKASGAGWIAAAEGSVWLSASGAPLTRIDPRVNRVVQQFTGEGGGQIAAGHKALWILVRPGVLWRVDPRFVEALR